jgi:hypothetical protein
MPKVAQLGSTVKLHLLPLLVVDYVLAALFAQLELQSLFQHLEVNLQNKMVRFNRATVFLAIMLQQLKQ